MHNIILASKSKVRKRILFENGINCTVEPANIDEEAVKLNMLKQKASPDIAAPGAAISGGQRSVDFILCYNIRSVYDYK